MNFARPYGAQIGQAEKCGRAGRRFDLRGAWRHVEAEHRRLFPLPEHKIRLCFWVFCFGMLRYNARLERRLSAGRGAA